MRIDATLTGTSRSCLRREAVRTGGSLEPGSDRRDAPVTRLPRP